MELELFIIMALSSLTGMFVEKFCQFIRSSTGVMQIDHSNPDKDVYRIELGDLDSLAKKRKIVLTIDHDADLSQK